jgi:hypothetical protein
LEGSWSYALSLLFLWLVAAAGSLALGVILARMALGGPRQAKVVGWLAWVAMWTWLLAAVRWQWLPARPVLWLWPLASLATGYSRLDRPVTAIWPLLAGLSGSGLLCLVAAVLFSRHKAIWQPK